MNIVTTFQMIQPSMPSTANPDAWISRKSLAAPTTQGSNEGILPSNPLPIIQGKDTEWLNGNTAETETEQIAENSLVKASPRENPVTA